MADWHTARMDQFGPADLADMKSEHEASMRQATSGRWRVVPSEPGHWQIRRGADACSLLTHKGAEAVYRAMTAAGEHPPAGTILVMREDGSAEVVDIETAVERMARVILHKTTGLTFTGARLSSDTNPKGVQATNAARAALSALGSKS